MNIQQLQYIVAVDEHRHFLKASEACFVTPATLSMMVKKLEQELNMTIFDRSKQPIIPTENGVFIIEKARQILYQVQEIEYFAKNTAEEISGELKMAIIPTLSPYLTHLFLPQLMKKYPQLKIKLFEWNTETIIEALEHNRLDIGIAATPLERKEIRETPLFYEKLVAYTTDYIQDKEKKYIAPEDLNLKKLWLLEEEHCLRSQVINLCQLKKQQNDRIQLDFEAGSIETLLNIVEINKGVTIIPELVVHSLSEERKKNIHYFQEPQPVREISLLTYRHFVKEKLIKAVAQEIMDAIHPHLSKSTLKKKIIKI